jgi:hypothetical protein
MTSCRSILFLLFVLGVLKEEDVLELGLYLASPEKYKDALKQAKHQTVAPIIIADSTGTCFEISLYCTSMLLVITNAQSSTAAGVAVQDVAIAKFCLKRMRNKK